MKTTVGITLASIGLLMTAAQASFASLSFYSNQSQLDGAATVSGPFNFDAYYSADQTTAGTLANTGFAQGTSFDFSTAGPGGPTSVTFTTPTAPNLFIDGTDGNDSFSHLLTPAFGTSVIDTYPSSVPSEIDVSFAQPTTAFGINLAEVGGGNCTITVFDAADPTGQVLTPLALVDSGGSTGAGFFAFTDTSDITLIDFDGIAFPGASGDMVLSSFSFGNTGANGGGPQTTTPEPSSLVAFTIMGLGIGGLLLRRRVQNAR